MSGPGRSVGIRPGTAAHTPRGPVFSGATPAALWSLAGRDLSLDVPVVMGILNLTPDSFSDGGSLHGVDDALGRAEGMVAAGARMLDVGGESTRPGAVAVPAEEELRRVLPFVRAAARAFDVPISVDTRKATVAHAVLEAGAQAINDVSGLHHDPDLASVVANAGAGVVLMHMRGGPATMGALAQYDRVAEDVFRELQTSVHLALSAGIAPEAIALDPGIGFAKTAAQNLELIRDLDLFNEAGFPVLVGPSRKSFLGAVLRLPPDQRVEGTLATCVAAYMSGARIFRVHDVKPTVRALAVAHAVLHPEVVG